MTRFIRPSSRTGGMRLPPVAGFVPSMCVACPQCCLPLQMPLPPPDDWPWSPNLPPVAGFYLPPVAGFYLPPVAGFPALNHLPGSYLELGGGNLGGAPGV